MFWSKYHSFNNLKTGKCQQIKWTTWTTISRGRMTRYNHIKIITHRTLYACLTHTIATVEVHHIISSTMQCVNCQLSVSIGRPYTITNISNGYNCVSNYIYTILYLYVIQFNNYGPIDMCCKELNVKTVILLYQTNFTQYCITCN